MMTVARRLIEGDALARSGQWRGWNLDQMCGMDVWGKTLGILGFGRIGRAVARRAKGFQMRVIYHSRTRAPAEVERELGAEFLQRDQVLAQADFLSLHVPLTPETRGLIGARELAMMKPTAFLVNTSRGSVVQEAALVEALAGGKIAGAALDVYEREPVISDGLRRPNVVLAPHMGSGSVETRTKMAMMAVENVIALFDGRRPPNILNPEVLEAPARP
jgi:glyoxylate reductase